MRALILAAVLSAGYGGYAEARGGSGGGRGFSYGTGSSGRSHYVAPHNNSNGSYTGGHYRTNPDGTRSNNYGSYGNYNYHNGGYGDGYGRSISRW